MKYQKADISYHRFNKPFLLHKLAEADRYIDLYKKEIELIKSDKESIESALLEDFNNPKSIYSFEPWLSVLFERNNVHSIDELTNKREKEILCWRNVGWKVLEKIKKELAKRGVELIKEEL